MKFIASCELAGVFRQCAMCNVQCAMCNSLSSSRCAIAALAFFLTALSGCGPAEPQFVSRPEVETLMPAAQDYVHELMEQNFGTPTDSVAWERFPLHYHAAVGAVAEGATVGQFELAPPAVDDNGEPVQDQWLPVEPGTEVLFVSGAVFDHQKAEQVAERLIQPIRVESYNEEERLVVLEEALPVAPAAGDRVILGPGQVLKHGRLLYAEHCQHCHGVSGDGAGPTAEYLNPRPRDYRLGIFKFTSTQTVHRARREDLAHIIEDGIPGTYMPSFKLLTPEESTAIVEYVLWLACRGETELKRVQVLALDYSAESVQENPDEALRNFVAAMQDQFAIDFDDETTQVSEAWTSAQLPDAEVMPTVGRTASDAESIRRGRDIFRSDTAKCATCHGEAGRGDGAQTQLVQKDKAGRDRDVPGLFDDWGNPIRPRDLTSGIYRGGRRPLDVYRRIYAGIKGTPMTGFGTSLTEEQIWDLVNYVMSIQYEQRGVGEGPFVPSEAATESVARINDHPAPQPDH